MTPPKPPSNTEVMAELKDLKKLVTPLINDVTVLKDWKMQEDAYKAARATIQQEENEKVKGTELSARAELIKGLGKLVGLLVIGVGAYLAGKGLA